MMLDFYNIGDKIQYKMDCIGMKNVHTGKIVAIENNEPGRIITIQWDDKGPNTQHHSWNRNLKKDLTMKKLKRFMVFAYNNFENVEPQGGWSDFFDSFDNLIDAHKFALGFESDNVEIVDSDSSSVIWSNFGSDT